MSWRRKKKSGFAGIAWMHAGMRGHPRRLSHSRRWLAGIHLFLGCLTGGFLKSNVEGLGNVSCVGHQQSLVSKRISVIPGFGPAAEALLFRQKDPKPLLPGRGPVGVPSLQAKPWWRITRSAQTDSPENWIWPGTQPRPRQETRQVNHSCQWELESLCI